MYLNARMIAVHTGTGPLVTEDPAEAGTAVRGGQNIVIVYKFRETIRICSALQWNNFPFNDTKLKVE